MNTIADAPQPPQPPQDNECCGNGCEDCVWIRYRQAEQQYRLALAEWQNSMRRADGAL